MRIGWGVFAIVLLFLFTGYLIGSVGKPDIKDDFCGVHISYQYCKCAFHNQYCASVGMSKNEAKAYVYSEYDAWIDKLSEEESGDEKYGVFEEEGSLYINSKPGEILEIETNDLPSWARGQIATVGATIVTAGSPDTIVSGESKVFLDGLPIARINDSTAHGGSIVTGSTKIFVNGIPAAIIGSQTVDPTIVGVVPSIGGSIVSNIE